MERRLSRLAVTDFRFLATLGMTGRRGQDRSCKSVLSTPLHHWGRDTQTGFSRFNSPRLNS